MSSVRLAFSSEGVRRLSTLRAGARGTVADVRGAAAADRLIAAGVTPGAPIVVLQTFPAIVFRCDQTELAVERDVAEMILVTVSGGEALEGAALRPARPGAAR